MKTELLGQEKNVVKVKVEFEAGEFASCLDAAIQEIAGKANIPGFRKGRTPRRVIEMRFGRPALYSEALEKLIPNAVEQVVGDYDLETIAPPSLHVDSIDEGQPLSCELAFEVLPEIVLPELGDIEVERLIPTVTDEALDATVKEFQKRLSTLSPVDRPAEAGDVLSLNGVSEVPGPDGEPVRSEEQQSEIDLADPAVRAEVKNALLGKTRGEAADAEFVVDEDYENKAVAGKKFRYFFTVDEVKERILPEMAPDFYKKVTDLDLDSEAAFREELTKRILANLENESMMRSGMTALGLIVSRSGMEVPETLLERQATLLEERDSEEAKKRFELDLDEVLRKSSIPRAEYEQGLREKAGMLVRRSLVIDEIGKKFDVEVEEAELDEEIFRMAVQYNIEPVKLKGFYQKNAERRAQVRNELRYGKIIKLILEKVRVKDVEKLSEPEAPETPETEPAAGTSEE
ncbi:MAG: trigger factor [Synergistaceae bacterium]|jgi:trigger factor|nr:trigger factor [Synergistaceae bacterium]